VGTWHAWQQGEVRSLCTLIVANEGLPHGLPAPGQGKVCYWCRRATGLPTRPPATAMPVEPEEMRARFEGGPFDGEVIPLKIVRTSPTTHTVLGSHYTRAGAAARPDPTKLVTP
jgi:hypothetical protein